MAGHIEEKFPNYIDALREGVSTDKVMEEYGHLGGDDIPGVIPSIRVVQSTHARHPTGNLVDPGTLESALDTLKLV